MPLEDVTQDFFANCSPYVDALGLAIEAADLFAEANHDALESVAELQAGIDLLHGKDISINVDTGGLGDAAGLAALDAQMDELIAHAEATKGAIDSLAEETAIDSAVMIAAMNRVGDAATDMAAKSVGAAAAAGSASGWAAQIGWMRLTATALHWIVAGSAEFLAVAVPGTVAFGSAMFVAAQGAQMVYQHLTAVWTAAEATSNMFHETMGSVLGLRSALQQAQNEANPIVWSILGGAINILKSNFQDLAAEGLDVMRVFQTFTANLVLDFQSGFGGQIHSLLADGVRDFTEFGQILGNVGHAILDLAGDMPGLAEVLLGLLDGASRLLELFSSMPGKIVTAYMALEEFNRWGSLVVGGLGRMGLAADTLSGSFFTFGSRTIGIMSNVAKAVPMALAAVTSNIGSAMTAWGRLGGEVEEGDGIFSRMGTAVGNAGMAVRDFGADMTDAVASVPAVLPRWPQASRRGSGS